MCSWGREKGDALSLGKWERNEREFKRKGGGEKKGVLVLGLLGLENPEKLERKGNQREKKRKEKKREQNPSQKQHHFD